MHKKPFIHWAWIILGTCFIDLFINYSVRLGDGVVLRCPFDGQGPEPLDGLRILCSCGRRRLRDLDAGAYGRAFAINVGRAALAALIMGFVRTASTSSQ